MSAIHENAPGAPSTPPVEPAHVGAPGSSPLSGVLGLLEALEGASVLGSGASLVGVGPFEARNGDSVSARDRAVLAATYRTADLAVNWILTKGQGR